MIVVLLIAACAVLLVAKFLRFRRKYLRAFASIPGPKGLPLLGNAVEMMFYDSQELHDKFELWVNQCGPRTKLDLCSMFWIIHSSPEDIEKIVTNNAFNRKSIDYDYLHEWLGNGILLDHGASWYVNRKALTDAFHFKVLENYLPVYQEQSEILVDKLVSYGGQVVDIFQVLKLYTLDVILETAMGVRCNAQANDTEYVRAVAGLTHITNWRMYSAIGQMDLTFRFSKYYQVYQEMLAVSNNFTIDVIKRRREEMAAGMSGLKEVVPTKRLALLDKLLQMDIEGRKLTDEEIQNQVNNFMFAGHDTTSSALAFTIFLLAKYPNIQDKLFKEVSRVLGDTDKPTFTQSTLNELKYMDQVIKETLRLYPTVPYISRTVDKDTELFGLEYPVGTTIMLGIFCMHRNPEYFPEPTRFKPERFDVDAGSRNPYVYIPFSAGGRNCIGQKFAMNEMKIALSHVIMGCRVVLEDPDFEPRLKDELILKPADGLPVRFISRK